METVIYLSRFHETAFKGIISLLKPVNPSSLDENHIVIVPDRYTLSIEKLLYPKLCGGGSFNISVTTLKRLAADFSAGKKYLSSCGGVMFARKAVKDCTLKCYEKSAGYGGFAKTMYDEICRLKNSLISPEMLLSAAEKAEGELKLRLFDIAAIYKRYLELTEGSYIDAQGYLNLIAENAKGSALIKKSRFYFAGFDELSSAEKRCFAEIVKYGQKCCFAVSSLGDNYEDIKQIILSAGHSPVTKSIEDEKNPVYDYIHEGIDGFLTKPYNAAADIKIFSFAGICDETENAAQMILGDIRDKNLRFKDISVILCSVKDYMHAIEKVFKKCGISYYVSESCFLNSKPLFKAVSGLLNCVTGNCEAFEVISFVKSGFFPEKKEKTDVFENYCLKYGIDRSRFLQPFTLCDETDGLETAESVRRRFGLFFKMIKNTPQSAQYFTDSVIGIINALDSGNTSGEFDKILNDGNYADEAAYNRQVKDRILKLLEETGIILRGEILPLKDFRDILVSGAESVKLSIVPVSADAVNCGGTESTRYNSPESVYVLGANDGVFPSAEFSKGLIASEDSGKMPELYKPEGDIREMLARERRKIKRFLCYPCKSLYISYPSCDDLGKELKPSQYVLKLKKMFSLDTVSGTISKLWHENGAYEDKTGSLMNAGELFFKNNNASVSAIETYFSCPRKYFYSYGLYCKTREQSGLSVLDVGNFLHAAAELFVKKYERSCDAEILAGQCFDIVCGDQRYKRFFVKAADFAAFSRLKNETARMGKALAKQIDNSAFIPTFFEAEFKPGGIFKPVSLDTKYKKIDLIGKIDRADVYGRGGEKYIRVIDYKSGSVTYEEKQLYFGLKIQLFLYMDALKKSGYKAAGLYYLPLSGKFITKDESPYRLLGVTVNDNAVLKASDSINGLAEGESALLCLTLKKDGDGFKGNANLRGAGDIDNFVTYGALLAGRACNEILEGFTALSPSEKACAYCDYINVCGKMAGTNIRRQSLSCADKMIGEAVNGY